MFDSNKISTLTAPALQTIPWINALESRVQAARQAGHWSLWLDKYAYPWAIRCEEGSRLLEQQKAAAKANGNREREKQIGREIDLIPAGKSAALSVACELNNKSLTMKAACEARQAFIKQLKAQHALRFQSIPLYNHSPLILHLGRASVLENVGLYADRTTGLPLIPGTAIKGVLSTWATWEANQNTDLSFPETDKWQRQRKDFSKSDHARRILGCDNEGGSEHAGDIIFVGAFPKTPPLLGLDLVNPHHDEQGKDKTRLTPSAFLCIQPNTQWDFIFFARPGTTDAADLLATTELWLCEALEHMGLGAKTASGYGRFGKDAPRTANVGTAGKPITKEDIERQAQDEALKARALASMQSDFPNEPTFKARILDKLNPGSLAQLEKEIPTLQKPDNADRLQQLKTLLASKDYKEIRKRLRDKAWFPQDWLPTP